MTNLRENLLLDILLLGSGIYVVVTLTMLVNRVFSEHTILRTILVLSSIIALIFFCYLLWITNHATKALVLGDNTSDSEKLITEHDGIFLGEQLRTQIIPHALFEKESPRANYHIKTFKGSYFVPPRIIISINICSWLEANEAQRLLKSMHFNRVLELLRHKKRRQKIDVAFNHMDKIVGYQEFINVADNDMIFWSFLPVGPQLISAQNTTQALLKNHTPQFLHFLNFAHKIPNLSSAVDTLLADLLLVDKEANSRVYFLTS
jgi:hypothetical protein